MLSLLYVKRPHVAFNVFDIIMSAAIIILPLTVAEVLLYYHAGHTYVMVAVTLFTPCVFVVASSLSSIYGKECLVKSMSSEIVWPGFKECPCCHEGLHTTRHNVLLRRSMATYRCGTRMLIIYTFNRHDMSGYQIVDIAMDVSIACRLARSANATSDDIV